MFNGFSFAAPWVLFLLLLIPPLAFLRGKSGGTAGVTFSSTSALLRLGQRRRSRAGSILAALSYLALAAFIIGLARPQFGRETSRIQASGVDIMLELDVSGSMQSEDMTIGGSRASRIDVVKNVTEDFIRQRANDRLGIIAFAGRPYLVSPLTLDHDWLIQNLDRIRLGLVEDGTAIGSAIVAAANRLKEKEAKTKLIVLLTDGQNNCGKVSPMTAAEAAKALGIRIYTIGIGTAGQAPFPTVDAFGRKTYQMIPCDIDEKGLEKIAEITNGKFYRATDTHALKTILNEIDKQEKTKIEVQKIADYRDLFPWFLMVGLACLVTEILLSQTIWRRLP